MCGVVSGQASSQLSHEISFPSLLPTPPPFPPFPSPSLTPSLPSFLSLPSLPSSLPHSLPSLPPPSLPHSHPSFPSLPSLPPSLTPSLPFPLPVTIPQLIVMVSDTNDNTPSFSSSSFSYLLPENSPSGTALSPTQLATDEDEGVNSDLLYSLSPSGLPFAVNPLTGVVTVTGTLDRETTPTYTLSLVATDQGAGNREGRTDIT